MQSILEPTRLSPPTTAIMVARVCAAAAMAGGLVSMSGWVFDIPRLIDWDGDGITIKFNAALGVAACGAALLLKLRSRSFNKIADILAAFALVLGLLTLLQHATGADFGIDTILFDEPPGSPATTSPGRMGLPASTSLSLLGISILLISYARVNIVSSILGTFVSIVAGFSIAGYLFQAPQLFSVAPFTSIAFQTAVFLELLAIAAVAAVPDAGFAGMLRRQDAGGRVFRRMVFPVLFLWGLLTVLRGATLGLAQADLAFWTAVRSMLELIALVAVLWWTSAKLSRSDAALAAARRAQTENETYRIVAEAQEAERRRIARDLHDSVGQELTALRLLLRVKNASSDGPSFEDVESQAERLDRELSMLIWELRPKVLDQYGLDAALDNFTRAWTNRTGIQAVFHSNNANERLPSRVETALYRIAQEAMNNVLKHARATEVAVTLDRRNGQAVMTLQDNGVGFRPDTDARSVHTTDSGGFGLIGMRERAALVGGQFGIESQSGHGTCITVRVPLDHTAVN